MRHVVYSDLDSTDSPAVARGSLVATQWKTGWAKVAAALTLLALASIAHAQAVPRHRAPVAAFRREHPCPSTGKTTGACRGYVVDHLVSLCWGGLDTPENMQWQSVSDGKKKDVFEVQACALKRKYERLERECNAGPQ